MLHSVSTEGMRQVVTSYFYSVTGGGSLRERWGKVSLCQTNSALTEVPFNKRKRFVIRTCIWSCHCGNQRVTSQKRQQIHWKCHQSRGTALFHRRAWYYPPNAVPKATSFARVFWGEKKFMYCSLPQSRMWNHQKCVRIQNGHIWITLSQTKKEHKKLPPLIFE